MPRFEIKVIVPKNVTCIGPYHGTEICDSPRTNSRFRRQATLDGGSARELVFSFNDNFDLT